MEIGRHRSAILSLQCMFLLTVLLQVVPCFNQIEFGPDDPDNNGVIFVGENVTLRCEVFGASQDEWIQFSISNRGKALIANNTNLSEGNVTVINASRRFIKFVSKSFATGEYNCTAISRRKDYGWKVYKLELYQQGTVQCQRTVTDKYISKEVVLLSCYFGSAEDKIIKWFKNNTNGTMELNSEKVEINDFKHKVVTVIQPSDELSLSNYFCGESQVVSMNMTTEPTNLCTVGSFLVYNDAFVFFTPQISSIPPGSSLNLTCDSITLPQENIDIPLWQLPSKEKLPIGVVVNVTVGVVEIQVSPEAEVGALINITCNAFLGSVSLSADFSIVIALHESTNPATQIPNDDNTTTRDYSNSSILIRSRKHDSEDTVTTDDVPSTVLHEMTAESIPLNIIILLVACCIAVVLIFILVYIILVCLCLNRREDYAVPEFTDRKDEGYTNTKL